MAGEWKPSKEEASYVKSCEKWVHGICVSGNCRDGNEARYIFVDGETGVERRWVLSRSRVRYEHGLAFPIL